jgi:hypothetical protein
MDALELVTRTSAPINGAGAAFYFDGATLAAGDALGLDAFHFYCLGRGGVLGDVEPAVVASAFGYFHPAVVDQLWTEGRAIISPRDAAKAYLAAADEFGRVKLTGVDGIHAFNDAAEAIIAHVDGSALALFAGVAAEPLPDDAPACAYRNVVTLRELRGSVHLVAVVAEGLHPATAHAIRRPGDIAMFGYQEAPVASDADEAALRAADVRTDKLLAAWFEVLDDGQRTALADGVDAVAAALGV